MADNKKVDETLKIVKKLDISFYLCKPYHSWECVIHENMYALIRHTSPKSGFSEITDGF